MLACTLLSCVSATAITPRFLRTVWILAFVGVALIVKHFQSAFRRSSTGTEPSGGVGSTQELTYWRVVHIHLWRILLGRR